MVGEALAPVTSEACTTLPGAPRALEATLTGDRVLVSWAAPISSSCTRLTGYVVVLSAGEPIHVDARTTQLTVAASPDLRVPVAAMNEVGCSALTGPAVPVSATRVVSAR